jgi:hypothetical protein
MSTLLLIWVGLLFALILFAVGKPGTTGVLTLSYFLALSLLHVPGAALFITPNPYVSDARETELGFELTLIGLSAFVTGAVFARVYFRHLLQSAESPHARKTIERHIWSMLLAGATFYFVVMPRAAAIPSGTALVSSLGALMLVAIWLRFYCAIGAHSPVKTLTTLFLVLVLPAASLTGTGQLGYGVIWAICCIAFLFVITRWRLLFYAFAPVATYAGASAFANYLLNRANFRVAYAYQSALIDRVTQVFSLFDNFQWLDLNSPLVSVAIDTRLNQNYLDGLAAERYLVGAVKLAYGSSIQLWALIPRALWPGKPQVGGGGDVVSNFTGLAFDPTTSVGAGQVMEFYMNFALPGLVLGFFLWGFLLMRFDCGIFRSLKQGDMRGLLLCALPGTAMLQPEGNLLAVLASLGGAVAASRLLVAMGWFGTAPEKSSAVAVQPAE